jgi:hypothetical protein
MVIAMQRTWIVGKLKDPSGLGYLWDGRAEDFNWQVGDRIDGYVTEMRVLDLLDKVASAKDEQNV